MRNDLTLPAGQVLRAAIHWGATCADALDWLRGQPPDRRIGFHDCPKRHWAEWFEHQCARAEWMQLITTSSNHTSGPNTGYAGSWPN